MTLSDIKKLSLGWWIEKREAVRTALHREQPQPNYDKMLRQTTCFLERESVEQRKSAGQQMMH
jgi:hypothetical protein